MNVNTHILRIVLIVSSIHCAMTGQMMQVQVPAGVSAGQQFQVNVNGQMMQVQANANAGESMTIQVAAATTQVKDERLTVVNEYRVSKVLGKGAYGEVFLVKSGVTKQQYALKVLKRSVLKRVRTGRTGSAPA